MTVKNRNQRWRYNDNSKPPSKAKKMREELLKSAQNRLILMTIINRHKTGGYSCFLKIRSKLRRFALGLI